MKWKGSNKSVMEHVFSQIPKANIPRSVFNRSRKRTQTMNAGYLVPILVDEVLPGDTVNLKANLFCRMNTLIVPFMDNLYIDTFYFFVPLRLVWSNFTKFMGEKELNDSTTYLTPQITPAAGGFVAQELSDYLGLPIGVENLSVNSFHHRAYNKIWNDWFRDENLQASVTVDLDDGPDSIADYVLLKRGKRHDYFTSCLPWPQKGTAVNLPLGSVAPVIGIGKGNQNWTDSAVNVYETAGTGTVTYDKRKQISTSADEAFYVKEDPDNEHFPAIFADLENATAATINSLRQAFQLQRLYERDARGGTRYTEIVRSHFGVVSPDARLQRPEFLGGASTPIMLTPIAQTSSTDATTPQANLAGVGVAAMSNDGFTKSFTEHGVLLGLAMIRADQTYQYGIPRMFSRRTKVDYYWPALAHLGEQEVLNKEIYAQGTADDLLVFGYQERYAEYRYGISEICGRLRSSYTPSLDKWHLAIKHTSLPTLNSTFIKEAPPVNRVVAVTSEPDFFLDAYFESKWVRPMPVYSVPGLIDHF